MIFFIFVSLYKQVQTNPEKDFKKMYRTEKTLDTKKVLIIFIKLNKCQRRS